MCHINVCLVGVVVIFKTLFIFYNSVSDFLPLPAPLVFLNGWLLGWLYHNVSVLFMLNLADCQNDIKIPLYSIFSLLSFCFFFLFFGSLGFYRFLCGDKTYNKTCLQNTLQGLFSPCHATKKKKDFSRVIRNQVIEGSIAINITQVNYFYCVPCRKGMLILSKAQLLSYNYNSLNRRFELRNPTKNISEDSL